MSQDFEWGYEDGWLAVSVDDDAEPIREPEQASEDYLEGFWCGVYAASAWLEGWKSCERGVMACLCDRDDEACGFHDYWKAGYAAAMEVLEPRHAC